MRETIKTVLALALALVAIVVFVAILAKLTDRGGGEPEPGGMCRHARYYDNERDIRRYC